MKVGHVTSGSLAPSLGKMLGMAYLPIENSAVDQQFEVELRGRMIKCVVVKTPFYKRDY
jgi:glycine cleavage system aminomethyltransferase T